MVLVRFWVYNRYDYAMFNLFWKDFGMSSNLRSPCSIAGLGKKMDFFDLIGIATLEFSGRFRAMLGGFVAVHFMSGP